MSFKLEAVASLGPFVFLFFFLLAFVSVGHLFFVCFSLFFFFFNFNMDFFYMVNGLCLLLGCACVSFQLLSFCSKINLKTNRVCV